MKKIIMIIAAIAIVGISVAAIANKTTAPDDFIGPRQHCKDLLVATDTDENGNVEVYIDNEYCSWYN